MSGNEQAVIFVRQGLSPDHPTRVSELYQSARTEPRAMGESSIRRAIWYLVSRGEVEIDGEMRLRTNPRGG